jgi:hypothetical protein
MVDAQYHDAEVAYFQSTVHDQAANQARYFGLRELGDHAAVVRALLKATDGRSLGTGPIPRTTVDALGLPCSQLLTAKLVAVEHLEHEVDLVKTMDVLVRNYRYYRREYDGLSAMARKWNAPREEISDRWGELSSGMVDSEAAIAQLSAILAAVCR